MYNRRTKNNRWYGVFENVAAGDYYIAVMDEQTPWQNGYYTWTHDEFASWEEAEAYVQKRIADTTAYAVYFDEPAGTGYIDTVHCYAGAWMGRHGYYADFKSLEEAEECLNNLLY